MALSGRDVTVHLKADISSYLASMGLAGKATNDFTTSLNNGATSGASGFSKIGLAAAAATAGVVALGVGAYQAISAFSDFDVAMSAVEAATMASASTMGELEVAALDAGRSTVFSAEEAARGMESLAKAGISTTDIMGGALTGALDLAAAGQIDVGAAAEIAASAMTQFNLSGADVPHIADLMAAAAGKAQGTVTDMAAAMNQAGLVASGMGLSIEETVGTLAAFASAGLIGSDAGTSFRTMLLRLANPSQEAAQLMEQLGISVYDAQGNFIGMEAVAGELQTSLQGLTQEQRNAALATIFGSDAIRAANILYEQGAGGIANWVQKVNDAGYAAEQAAIKSDNLAGDMERLGGAIDAALIQAGGAADAILRNLVQTLTSAVDSLSGMGSALAVLEPLWNSLGGILENVWNILGNLASAVEPVVSAFLSLVGGVVLGGLELIANILEGITGFLAENEAVATALALTIGGVLAASFVRAQLAAVGLTLSMTGLATVALAGTITAVGGIGTALAAARVAAVGLVSALGPLAALAFGATIITGLLNIGQASGDAQAAIDDLHQAIADADTNAEAFDLTTQGIEDMRASLADLQAELTDMTTTTSVGDWLGDIFSYFADGPGAIGDTEAAIRLYADAIAEAEQKSANFTSNTAALANEFGITEAAVLGLADAAGIDLTQGYEAVIGPMQDAALASRATTAAEEAAAVATDALAGGMLDAAEKVDALVIALQGLQGNLALGDQINAFERAMDDAAAAALELANASLGPLDNALNELTGGLDQGTLAGQNLWDSMRTLADEAILMSAQFAAAGDTINAQGAYDRAREQLLAMAEAAGITGQAAEDLVNMLLTMPEDFTTTIGIVDEATPAVSVLTQNVNAELAAAGFEARIGAIPDFTLGEIQAMVNDVMGTNNIEAMLGLDVDEQQALIDIGRITGVPYPVLLRLLIEAQQAADEGAKAASAAQIAAQEAANAGVNIPFLINPGDAEKVNRTISDIVNADWRTTVFAVGDVSDAEVKLNSTIGHDWRTTVYGDGDTSDAEGDLSATIGHDWRTTVYGDGDTSDAEGDLNATIGHDWRTTVYGDGNVDHAWNALSGVVNTSWNTTIYVGADTSSAWNSINAVKNAQHSTTIKVNTIYTKTYAAEGGYMMAPGYAGGGKIRGPGTGTSDSIPARFASGGDLRVSNGEYLMNAVDTARNLSELEAANWDHAKLMVAPGYSAGGAATPTRTVPHYAMGGQVSTADALRDALTGMNAKLIAGKMQVGPDGLFQLIDGRIQLSDDGKRQAVRAGQRRAN